MSIFIFSYDLICENTIDKSLLLFDKPIEKILNKKITLYHGSCYDIKDKYLTPKGINVGATKFSTPRWSTFFWDNRDNAIKWSLCWSVGNRETIYKTMYRGQHAKILICCKNGKTLSETDVISDLIKGKIHGFIYSATVPSNIVEIGSCTSIKEYTVSEKVRIDTKEKVYVTEKLFHKFFELVSEEEFNRTINNIPNDIGDQPRVRGTILNYILKDYRDLYRKEVRKEIKLGNIIEGDDISHLKKQINDAINNDMF